MNPLRPVALLGVALIALGCGGESDDADGLVYATPSGSFYGSLSSSPAGISMTNSSGRSAEAFGEGTRVRLTATTDENATFVGWSGEGCSGTGVCEVMSKGPGFYQYVLATFSSTSAPPRFALRLESPPRSSTRSGGAGSITVESTSGSTTFSTDGGELLACEGQPAGSVPYFTFDEPTVLRLTATAGTGSTFTGWLAFGCGADPVCEVQVSDTELLVYAFFDRS
jgi:hypothetical protein